MLAKTTRKRGRKRLLPNTTTDSLTTHLDPAMVHEIDLWAKRIGVSRSELARWAWPKMLTLIKRLGRNKIRSEIEERRDASRKHENDGDDADYFASVREALRRCETNVIPFQVRGGDKSDC
ncbi:MAG: hypothetical protein M0T85_01855 [Dehalococcoidales bacterium]|nr:hypothetical protein [Dehalococcoidales bacterium]